MKATTRATTTRAMLAVLFAANIGVQAFVTRSGTRFTDECGEYLVHGWNTWNYPLMDFATAAAANPIGAEATQIMTSFAEAQANGLNTMRMFLSSPDGSPPMIHALGVYNEDRFKGLDFVFYAASLYNVKLIPVFLNHWQTTDSAAFFLNPSSPGSAPSDQFWSDPEARARVKDYMTYVVNRVNTFTGRAYKDDPTIFGWNLYNEQRCPAAQNQDEAQLNNCLAAIGDWINDIACHLKSVDPNHMVGLGQEGFFGRTSDKQTCNPTGTPSNVGPGWSAWVGQDFESQHSSQCIDFLSFHMWKDNWQTFDLNWIDCWVQSHIDVANRLGKPLILQEFGKRTDRARAAEIRDPVFRKVYDLVANSIGSGGPLRGSLVWYWDALRTENNPATSDHNNGNFPPKSAVLRSDGSDASTWALIAEHGTWQKSHAPRGCGVTAATIAG